METEVSRFQYRELIESDMAVEEALGGNCACDGGGRPDAKAERSSRTNGRAAAEARRRESMRNMQRAPVLLIRRATRGKVFARLLVRWKVELGEVEALRL